MTGPAALSRLEIGAGIAWGIDPEVEPLAADASQTPRQVLDRIMVEALQSAPCVVSFSGGRDSAVILALATDAARHHGLALPIPVTLRFADDPLSHEDEWQERVIEHLGLTEWVRLDLHDELDIVGRYAAPLLRDHGLFWPFNAYFHSPCAEQARGGVVLTGYGGDEVFGRSRWHRANLVRHGRVRPSPRDAARLAVAYGPLRIRAGVIERHVPIASWLTPVAARSVRRSYSRAAAAGPVDWDEAVRYWWQQRQRSLIASSRAMVDAAHATRTLDPFADSRFLAAIAASVGPVGFGDRTEAMRTLFGDLLPDAVLARRTKAGFLRAFWGPEAAAFGAQWNGSRIDPTLVDTAALRQQWRQTLPSHAATFTLLQAEWLAEQQALTPGASAVS